MDAPPRTSIDPQNTSPISLVVMAVSGWGILFSFATMTLVTIFRKRQIFKASRYGTFGDWYALIYPSRKEKWLIYCFNISPMFCTLELVGFILSYTALVLMVQEPSVTSCYVIPTTFHLGYCLIMG